MGLVRGDGVHDIGGDGGEERMQPPDFKQGFLLGIGGRAEVSDAAHDQAAGDALGCTGGCEVGERDLGDLVPGYPNAGVLVAFSVRILDRCPRVTRDRFNRALHQRALADGDADLRPGFHCGMDGRAAVVRGVGAQDEHPDRAWGSKPANSPKGVGDNPFRSLRRVRGALAQAGRDDDRGAAGRGHGRRCGVQSADAGVAERRTLFALAVDLHDRAVEVDQCEVVDPGEQWCPLGEGGEGGEEPGRGRVELANVAERERPQEALQRRRGVAVGERLTHGAVAQDRRVLDRVRARAHPRDQAHRLQVRVRAVVRQDRDMRRHQVQETRGISQRDQRDQPRGRDEIRVIECRADRGRGMRWLRLRDVPRSYRNGTLDKSCSPAFA